MIKKNAAAFAIAFCAAFVFAYNPPAGGENIFRLSSPELLMEGNSSTGGCFFSVSPDSAVNNPALTAFEQRVVLNASGTMMFDGKDASGSAVGGAMEAGLLIPSRWYVYSFLLQGVFVPFQDMNVGNSVSFTANAAKDLTDNFSVGIGANLGVAWGNSSDWLAGFNIGAFYNAGSVSFMKDLRFSAVLVNFGKPLSNMKLTGISGSECSIWPGPVTFGFGAAAVLFDSKSFDIASSLDFSFPTFQNFVADAAVQFMLFDSFKISSCWELNARELANGYKNIVPSVSLGFKFTFSSKDGSLLANKGWSQSEMTVNAGWRQLYENINAVSAGARINLGLKDTQAPEIILWND